MTCGIYKIQNKINGKIYIGQSVNIEQRWKAHKVAGKNTNHEHNYYPLYKAMYKYGLDNFDFSIIEECSKDKLNEREKYWILYYDSLNNGYNQVLEGVVTKLYGTLTQNEVKEIKELLLNSTLTQTEIGNKYNIGLNSICAINNGRAYYDENIEYPIRKFRIKNNYSEEQKEIVIHNNGMKHYCANCGKELKSSKNTLCRQCYNKAISEHIPSRDELKNKIRNTSFEAIAKEYGFKTGNTPKKWCKKLGLPYLRSEIEKYSDEEWIKI